MTSRITIETPTIDPAVTTIELLRAKADGLTRMAIECIRQQDRCARLNALDCGQTEKKLAREAATQADRALATMVESYEKSAARLKPDGADELWWKKANAVWMAAREYSRRHSSADGSEGSARHSGEVAALGELQLDAELEASALLAMRHAADAYRAVRAETIG
ncbi:MAG: hypothetical protein MUF21_10365 [Gemmatimonadaceae bacterium]|jgi:hypothetical protein|nr:hypothetical protein [Gemmatimonadaceae bacterium]